MFSMSERWEQDRLLRDERDLPAQIGQRYQRDVDAAERDGAAGGGGRLPGTFAAARPGLPICPEPVVIAGRPDPPAPVHGG